MYRAIFPSILFCLIIQTSLAQSDTINQTDHQGQKQGYWKGYHPNGNLKYEGRFKDNVPVGMMKRYYINGNIQAKMFYKPGNDTIFSQLYSANGKLNAEGIYISRIKDGVWNYYSDHLEALISEVPYIMGKKHGIVKNYYPNGQINEEIEYKNDIEDGIWRQYFEDGQLKFESGYINGIIDGTFTLYHYNGYVDIKGQYKQGLREGTWLFYDISGKKLNEIVYIDGVPENLDEIREEQQRFFDQIEQNKGRYPDPTETIYGN